MPGFWLRGLGGDLGKCIGRSQVALSPIVHAHTQRRCDCPRGQSQAFGGEA